ncbi:MAG TPA: hypothetical protein VFJ14_10290 [Nocardioidaceae bacterium]|nr:hypothetical protein [Nocardioidaceae bacterium]
MGVRKVTHSEKWWETQKPAHVLRCTANYKSTGERCRREAAPGANVCASHGALAPQVQAAAAVRIGMSVDEAAKALRNLAFDENGDPRVRLKAIQDILDRGGLGATQKHLVGVVGNGDPVETLFRDILSDPDGLAPAAPALPAPPVPDAAQAALDARQADPDWDAVLSRQFGSDDPDDVVDAELVEDSSTGQRPHTVEVEGSLSDRPPKWLEEDLLRRLI